jgi:hypothetical protein
VLPAVSRQEFQHPGTKLILHLLARCNMQRIRRPQTDSYPVAANQNPGEGYNDGRNPYNLQAPEKIIENFFRCRQVP